MKCDLKKFANDFKGARMKQVIQFSLEQEGWFNYDLLFNESIWSATRAYKGENKNYQGGPAKARSCIKTLIQYGFFLIDPVKGLKVNPNFVPENQKPRSFLSDV